MDLYKAEIGGEAGGADVAAVLWPDGLGGRTHNLKGGWTRLVAVQLIQTKSVLLGPGPHQHGIGGPEASQPASAMLARNSLRPGVKLTWKYASQTGGLVHAQTGLVSQ